MKNIEKLPLSFEYLEKSCKKFDKKGLKNTIFYLKSNQIQTKCLIKRNPFKPLIRMI